MSNSNKINERRAFLSLFGSSAIALSMRYSAFAESESTSTIALLSDTHIHRDAANEYRGFRPSDNLKEVANQVAASSARMALVCGDAARLDGNLDDYVHLLSLLEPIRAKMPVEIALGNHDDRANFWKVFGAKENNVPMAGKKHVSVLDVGPQRWIVLDSLMFVDKTPGFLGQEQREWLNQTLAQDASRPVVLMVHHTLGEKDGDLLDTEKLLAIAHKHPHVKAIVFGHSHEWKISQDSNLWLINLPAIGYNFNDEQPIGWVSAELGVNELKLTLSAIGGNTKEHSSSRVLSWT